VGVFSSGSERYADVSACGAVTKGALRTGEFTFFDILPLLLFELWFLFVSIPLSPSLLSSVQLAVDGINEFRGSHFEHHAEKFH
jgi:hypothetical protein